METQLNQKQGGQKKQVAGFFLDLFKILGLSLLIIIPFRLFIAEPFVVSGSSMVPNFHNRDYLIVDRLSYRSSEPKRGDVVVIKYPKDNRQYFIKRIIGLPGETVEISGGGVVISNQARPNGFKLEEGYLPKNLQTLGKPGPVILGSGEFFVLGDNRTASSDSRVWGILPQNDIVGRAWLRVFPLGDFGLIKTPTYENGKN